MIKMFLVFAVVFAIFWYSINIFRALKGREKWKLTKVTAYSIMCATVSTGFLMAMVILF